MKRAILKRLAPAALGALALVAGGAMLGADGATAQGDEPVSVLVGDGEPGYAVNEFLPENLTVVTGTTVHYVFEWFEIHSVTIGAPMGNPFIPLDPLGEPVEVDSTTETVHSGVLPGPQEQTFQITFAEAGEYNVYCIIHPFMTSVVTVVDEESDDVDTAETAATRGDEEYAAYLAELQAIAAALDAAADHEGTPNDDGTSTYDVTVSGANEHGDVQQFFDDELDITVGDSVRFTNTTFTPHTATFNFGIYFGGLTPEEQAAFDPLAIPATDVPVDSETFVHSGVIAAEPLGLGESYTGTSFEVSFGEAGSFDYVCLLHEDQGMAGTVNVQEAEEPTPTATEEPTVAPTEEPTPAPTQAPPTPAPPTPTQSAPQPPATGSGGFNSSTGGPLVWMLILGSILIFGGASAAAIRARR